MKIFLDFTISDLCLETTFTFLHFYIFPVQYLNACFHSSWFMHLLWSVPISGFLIELIRKILQFVISSFIFVFIML